MWLEETYNVISEMRRNDHFWFGIPKTRKHIHNRFFNLDPARDVEETPAMEDVVGTGRCMLSEEVFDLIGNKVTKLIRSASLVERWRRRDAESSESGSSSSVEESELESEDESERMTKMK